MMGFGFTLSRIPTIRPYYYGDDRYRYYRHANEYRWHGGTGTIIDTITIAIMIGIDGAERNPTEAERLASDLIELSTRQNLAYFLTVSAIYPRLGAQRFR